MNARILALALLLVGQAPEPDIIGPEDPAHQGQPRTCSNSPHIKAVKRDCKCEKKTPEACDPNSGMGEQRICYVYCRKPACKCSHPECETE